MQEHYLDRLMRRLRPVIIAALVLAGPVFLLSYVLMLKQMLLGIGWWSAPVVVAHVLTWLGIASLFDSRQSHPPR